MNQSAATDTATYVLCRSCDHFVEEESIGVRSHLCDEVHHDPDADHDPYPRDDNALTVAQWQELRPDLFERHPDGLIGPNSEYHITKGLPQPQWAKARWKQFKYKGETYIAVPQSLDRPLVRSTVTVLRLDGTNYGAYHSIENFKKYVDNGSLTPLGEMRLIPKVVE